MPNVTLAPRFSATYSPTWAEDGKFVPLDKVPIISEGYPASGMGKFAILSYVVNPVETLSTSAIETIPANNSLFISSSAGIPSNGVSHQFTFESTVNMIEIFNLTPSSTAYVLLSADAPAAAVSSQGIPIIGSDSSPGFYSVEHQITTMSIYVQGGVATDLRIFGHYKA